MWFVEGRVYILKKTFDIVYKNLIESCRFIWDFITSAICFAMNLGNLRFILF